MTVRGSCLVPFCRVTIRCDGIDDEVFCGKHFRLASREARVEYSAAWNEADKADRRAEDGIEPNAAVYARVTAAWQRLKAEVMQRALGGAT